MAQFESPPQFEGLRRFDAFIALRNYLARQGASEADADARLFIREAFGGDALALARDPHQHLDARIARCLTTFAERRARHEPVSRILGRRGFWSLEIVVAPRVLDPRGDSEALIRLVLRTLRIPPRLIGDLGSGSGALLCALLEEYRCARGLAVDLSPLACAATQKNLQFCGVSDRSCVMCGVWAEAVGNGMLDLIISNPPYIPTSDIATLAPEVAMHDPILALDGGRDGLDAYRRLFQTIARALCPEGFFVLEAGDGQAEDILAIARRCGYKCLDAEKDLGGHTRALIFGAVGAA